jgi:hypothetical protein
LISKFQAIVESDGGGNLEARPSSTGKTLNGGLDGPRYRGTPSPSWQRKMHLVREKATGEIKLRPGDTPLPWFRHQLDDFQSPDHTKASMIPLSLSPTTMAPESISEVPPNEVEGLMATNREFEIDKVVSVPL